MRSLFFASITYLISLSVFSQNFEVDTIQFNGSSDTLINIVVLGDGYTENQLDQFVDDANNTSLALFNEPPFSNYQNYFNIFSIKVPSDVSGAANNPDTLIDNYFGSTYNSYGIERLLVPMRTENVTNVLANNFPSYDQVLMIVNDTRYGGSGGWVATYSTNPSSLEIFLHELGHSFADLADEYWAGSQYAKEAINMTQETNIEDLKWKNWYGDFGIGLYPHSESPEWYRPHDNCKMRFLGSAYCSVCKEGIVEQIHSLVSPLISYLPSSVELTPNNFPLAFRLNLIKPNPNTLQIQWILNNSPIEINSDSITINASDLISGTNNLSVSIEDTTGLLRVDGHNTIHVSAINWEIETTATGIGNVAISSKKTNISIYPNPFQDYIKIKYDGKSKENVKIEIVDMTGSVQVLQTYKQQDYFSINVKNLNKGFYIMNLYAGDALVTTQKLVKD